MVNAKPSAEEFALWRDDDTVWLDHVTLVAADASWLAKARLATFWNVKYPEGFLSKLPNLQYLDVRGGSGANANFILGCVELRFLRINQVRGMADLSAIEVATGLEFLSLFGLPQVASMPSLRALERLDRVELGSMKGLNDLSGLLEAPALTELMFAMKLGVNQGHAAAIANHPSIAKFEWFPEDVPDRLWVPFVERIGKPRAGHDWWERHSYRQP